MACLPLSPTPLIIKTFLVPVTIKHFFFVAIHYLFAKSIDPLKQKTKKQEDQILAIVNYKTKIPFFSPTHEPISD